MKASKTKHRFQTFFNNWNPVCRKRGINIPTCDVFKWSVRDCIYMMLLCVL